MDLPRWWGQFRASSSGALEGLRACTAEVAVPARSIVEHLDAVEDIRPGEILRLVDTLFDSLFLQAAKERLRHRLVPAVAAATYAGFGQTLDPPATESGGTWGGVGDASTVMFETVRARLTIRQTSVTVAPLQRKRDLCRLL